ncbi:MAG: diaminopimelate decarboxylase [Thermostichales cyanobacterium BF4_bins_65]
MPTSPNQSLLPVTASIDAQGHLHIGGCDVVALAKEFGTPLYVLDETSVRQGCQHYRQAFASHYPGPYQVLYASKAWSCLALCALMLQEGLGLDVASGGELYTALQAGAKGKDLYVHGNAKTVAELEMALQAGATLVVDSEYELYTLADLAAKRGVRARILLRVNPGIDVHTHEYIRTGQTDSKFGIGLTQIGTVLDKITRLPALDWVGFHAHIGSQIFDLEGHRDLGAIMAQLWRDALALGLQPQELNVGGGLGIRYQPDDDPPTIEAWVATVSDSVQRHFQGLPLPKLLCEPGRSLVGTAAVTLYTLGGSKQIPPSPALPQGRTYVTIDGGMSDNPRPITYQARYTAYLGNRMGDPSTTRVTVAGKHCESGDILLKDIDLPAVRAGDVLVVTGTGAYNYSMASNYNRYPRPAAVLVRDGQASVILQRETYGDLVRLDVLPSHWQQA